MPYPTTKEGKKKAASAFKICSGVKDTASHERCVNRVYKDLKNKSKKK